MKAILYARVSSKEQEQEGYSIPAQVKLLTEYARKKGFKVVREFTDVESAKQAGRKAFEEMLLYFKKNPAVNTLLVEKTDRLLRAAVRRALHSTRARRVALVRSGHRRGEKSPLLRWNSCPSGTGGPPLRGR